MYARMTLMLIKEQLCIELISKLVLKRHDGALEQRGVKQASGD